MITAGLSGDAVASHHKKHLHARGLASREKQPGRSLLLVSQQPVRLGPMRYYGGPKSPMWRAPVEN
jgi:hypothetical protein